MIKQLDISSLLPVSRKQAIKNKSKFYFTGQICAQGHFDKRYTYNGNCIICQKVNKVKHRTTERFRETSKEHYRKNKDKILKRAVRNRYNLNENDYNKLVEDQKGLCAICNQPENMERYNSKLKLCVDHNHKTKKVRQLLCHACNRGLGSFKEDINLMKNAIKYLEKHND